ncbi:MAG TPA: phytanoyl-CoA dioxygenase family protein [Sphingomicrobium sp.]|nr:phytanoyl-CoA dioxygenase family protein [Sphingomicrobium sp.]
MTSKAGLHSQIEQWSDLLSRQGWCIIPALVAAGTIADLDSDLAVDFAETPFCEGGFYGPYTKRFGRLLLRSAITAKLVEHPLITGIARRVLEPWCDTIQLNLTQALALHPGAPPQLPHRDQDMWRGSIGEVEYLVNVMWPFTPYTSENGATLIYPDSHGSKALDPRIPSAHFAAELEPGSALLFLGSTLHGAGGNRSNEVRRGAIVSYCLGWLKPYENQWLAYPPTIAKHFAPELAALVGYAQHRPNLGNFEGQCPSVLLKENVPRRLAAKDALRPDQEQQLAEFIRGQQSPERRERRSTI